MCIPRVQQIHDIGSPLPINHPSAAPYHMETVTNLILQREKIQFSEEYLSTLEIFKILLYLHCSGIGVLMKDCSKKLENQNNFFNLFTLFLSIQPEELSDTLLSSTLCFFAFETGSNWEDKSELWLKFLSLQLVVSDLSSLACTGHRY